MRRLRREHAPRNQRVGVATVPCPRCGRDVEVEIVHETTAYGPDSPFLEFCLGTRFEHTCPTGESWRGGMSFLKPRQRVA